jgi:D-serine deaminase-like pyridoxal phosphate-dependent protein
MKPEIYRVQDPDRIPSPALLFYPHRIEANIQESIRIAGTPDRLRPHVKTNKCPNVVALKLARGIRKFKCATIAEAEMLAQSGARDVVIAYQLVGPNISRFVALCTAYPEVAFRPLVDGREALAALSKHVAAAGLTVEVLVDLDVGMGRTGIAPDASAAALYEAIQRLPGLLPGGLHAYDGHIRHQDVTERNEAADIVYDSVAALRDELVSNGLPVPRLIMGGTPTFPCHARKPDVELSPGTCFLHDWNYERLFPDMRFQRAALLLGRVISRTGEHSCTVDIGHKAVAADPDGPRGLAVNHEGFTPVKQSEEHWVFVGDHAVAPAVGELFYVLPTHICPTVALHEHAYAVGKDGRILGEWPITARRRRIRI